MSKENGNKRRFIKLLGIAVGLLIIAALGFYGFTQISQSRYAVPEKYQTIQAAIDAASDGAVIVVAPGVYYERIDFLGKNITIRSTKPEDPEVVAATIIDGRRRGSVVTFQNGESSKAVLQGFTITGGVGTELAITQEYQGEVSINEGYYGGGILIKGGSSPTIINNSIRNNQADVDGGGIAVQENSGPLIKNNTFEDNRAFNGGGITVWKSSPVIEGNLFKGNTANYLGGAILVDFESSPLIKGNFIEANSSTSGGGIAVWFADPLIEENEIMRNAAIWYGGGIALFDANATLDGNNVARNSAENNGGGVAVAEGSNATITNNIISKNFTNENGGGIAVVEGSYAVINDNAIEENAVLFGGGGLYLEQSSADLDRNNITGNVVQQDGGGVALMNGAEANINNSLIDGNGAGRAGGGMVLGEGSSATIIDSTIAGNLASTGGAMIVLRSNLKMERCFILENTASSGSGGGILLVVLSVSEIIDTIFNSNVAFEFGGGLVAFEDSKVTLRRNDFIANVAQIGGAFIGFGDASIDLSDPDDNSYQGNVPEDVEAEEDNSNE